MDSIRKQSRIAGLVYLLLTVLGPFRLLYIPDRLFVEGDASATVANVASHELLFRFGMAGDLLVAVVSLFLSFALYRLFKGVDKAGATLMLLLGFMDTPLYMFNLLNDAAALAFAHGAGFLVAFGTMQRVAMAAFFLHQHGQAVVCAEVFWGLWLLPLAALVIRSRFLPRWLGYWLILNGIAYVVQSFVGLLLPQYEDAVSSIAFPCQFGEVAFMLWLMAVGARPGGGVTRGLDHGADGAA